MASKACSRGGGMAAAQRQRHRWNGTWLQRSTAQHLHRSSGASCERLALAAVAQAVCVCRAEAGWQGGQAGQGSWESPARRWVAGTRQRRAGATLLVQTQPRAAPACKRGRHGCSRRVAAQAGCQAVAAKAPGARAGSKAVAPNSRQGAGCRTRRRQLASPCRQQRVCGSQPRRPATNQRDIRSQRRHWQSIQRPLGILCGQGWRECAGWEFWLDRSGLSGAHVQAIVGYSGWQDEHVAGGAGRGCRLTQAD